MTRILFAPFSALGGLLAGLLGKRVFAAVWSLIDKEEPAQPEHRDAPWSKFAGWLTGACAWPSTR
jgi:xanthosine utilization system XapX-like protein